MSGYRFAVVVAFAFIARASEPAAARWEGVVHIPGREMMLVIDLAQDSGGKWVGSAIIPGYDVKGARLADVSVTNTDVAFIIKGALGDPKLTGHIAGTAFSGSFGQAGNTAPFELKSTGPPQVEPPRVSTPIRADLQGEWKGDVEYAGKRLRVTLSLKNQPGGTAFAKFVIIGQKENIFPLELVIQDGDTLTLESAETGLAWEGQFRKEANELTGAFSKGLPDNPMVLHRAQENH